MTRTFLVAENFVGGIIDPQGEAADIEDDLIKAGHDIVSVKMWSAPTLATPHMTQQQQAPLPPPVL